MGGLHWLGDNWLTVLNAAGVVGGLFFTGTALRSETKTRRIANLLTITTNHREIWKEFSRRPELGRVLDPFADIVSEPVTLEEGEFVNLVILHVSSVHYALKDELVTNLEGLRRDVGQFFSLPIPNVIWRKIRIFQNCDFVVFVESCQK